MSVGAVYPQAQQQLPPPNQPGRALWPAAGATPLAYRGVDRPLWYGGRNLAAAPTPAGAMDTGATGSLQPSCRPPKRDSEIGSREGKSPTPV